MGGDDGLLLRKADAINEGLVDDYGCDRALIQTALEYKEQSRVLLCNAVAK